MEGDDKARFWTGVLYPEFLSTPSGWRATPQVDFIHKRMSISIHALRVEGDTLFIAFFPSAENFYPRPPGGGRQPWSRIVSPSSKFLSTPSGWRATDYLIHDTETCKFLSTPSGWRATAVCTQNRPALEISIHALRVEGDSCLRNSPQLASCISIHALRVEGDSGECRPEPDGAISIHALRVEGDLVFQIST